MCVPRSITYSLSHLMSVVKHLDSNWARAFLRRTRLANSDFQGDVLAVISTFDLTFAKFVVLIRKKESNDIHRPSDWQSIAPNHALSAT